MLTTVKIRKRKDKRVPEQSVKIRKDGTARISSDLIDGTNCRYLPAIDISNKIIVLNRCQGLGEALSIWFSSKGAKSPFISLVSTLNQMGIEIKKAVGTYRATLTKMGIEIRMKERIGK